MLPWCIGKSENAFSGMKWDKYLFGVNQMRIVGKDDDISYIYCHNGNILPRDKCNIRRAKSNVAGQKLLAPPSPMKVC